MNLNMTYRKEDNMKVGDYVRFDYHRVTVPIQIANVIESHYDNEDDSICYSTDVGLVIDESNLVKEPSPNIMDLIEVGDYVNGIKVQDVIGCLLAFDGGQDGEWYIETEEDIKSIVTHEQFESMQYNLESEVN